MRLDSAELRDLAGAIREEVSVQMAAGLELSLWAPEQLLSDPHALSVDNAGRAYVFGSTRSPTQRALSDHYRTLLPRILPYETVLPHQTVEDLRVFLHRDLAPEHSADNDWLPDLNEDGVRDWRDLTVQKEQIYRVEDVDGDGRAERSQVIVEDFNTEVTDMAGGLLVHDDELFAAVAPGLWRLRDTSGDGVVDTREALSNGYGVRLSFYFAHGMSGVTLGPDGRIYWSVGDIGLNVVDQEGRRWSYPNQGAIMRANPDGSDFEVFAAGLRNIYEFAFDEYGNLISVDNDAVGPGEKERIVHVVEGSDSGWRSNFQWGKYTDPLNNRYQVWMDEGMSVPRFEGQPAHITPPVALYHNGPAGMVYNTGTALSERWRDHFLIAMNTKIHAFRLAPLGAGFKLARDTVILSGILTTSMDFGPDGSLFLADLMVKKKPERGGRIWKLAAQDNAGSEMWAETRALLGADFEGYSEGDLARLLPHPDMRVRMKAQFELAQRSAVETLLGVARRSDHQLARLHALWGVGQLARRDSKKAEPLTALLVDADPEVRAQAAKVIGDAEYAAAGHALIPLLGDESARVRFFAAQALGQMEHGRAVPALIAMLQANDDADAYLRHAGSLALARIGEADPLLKLADHHSRALRIAAVVALRRMQHPGVSRFLGDADEYVVTEAARAINDDRGIEAALPELARILEEDRFTNEALLRRAVNANLRLGTAEGARRVANFAARHRVPESLRVEAIDGLGVWPEPSPYDRVDGMERSTRKRDAAIARAAVEPLVEPLLTSATPVIKVALAKAVRRLDLHASVPALLARVHEDESPDVRIEALKTLHALGAEDVDAAVGAALADPEPAVRRVALELIPELSLPEARMVDLLARVLDRGSIQEQQSALERLGKVRTPRAHQVLASRLDDLSAGILPPEIHLELMEAVRGSGSPALNARLRQHLARTLSADDLPTEVAALLRGGDADRGVQVVLRNDAAQCTVCHSVGYGGSTVGPNLSRIGAALSRKQLLEALIDPSVRIAPGFGEAGAPSPMPPMGELLSPRQIRDVVEFLSTLR